MLGVPFYDTDSLLIAEEGGSIRDIFKDKGEAYFRGIESRVIEKLVTVSPGAKVVALGGGAFQSRTNRERVRRAGVVIHLGCSIREIVRRLSDESASSEGPDRPLLAVRPGPNETERQAVHARIKQLLAERRPGYREAHVRVSTTGREPDEVAGSLYARIKDYRARYQSQAG
jgi:shikimate kinase